MFKRNKNLQVALDPSDKLKEISPVGETIRLSNGAVFQKPNPAIIQALQAIDKRVHYFPTDIDKAQATTKQQVYYRGVTDLLPAQIMKDFPGERHRTAQRGTVVSLRDEFPYFKEAIGYEEPQSGEFLFKRIYANELLPMHNVLSMLQTGSDRGGIVGNLGGINSHGQLNTHTEDWLMFHTEGAIEELAAKGEWDKANNLFPGVLVYESSRIDYDATGNIADPTALVAIYITDRQIHDVLAAQPKVDALRHLGGVALSPQS